MDYVWVMSAGLESGCSYGCEIAVGPSGVFGALDDECVSGENGCDDWGNNIMKLPGISTRIMEKTWWYTLDS